MNSEHVSWWCASTWCVQPISQMCLKAQRPALLALELFLLWLLLPRGALAERRVIRTTFHFLGYLVKAAEVPAGS